MTSQHPITPSLELVEQWKKEWVTYTHIEGEPTGPNLLLYIARQAACWGADRRALEALPND